MSKWCAIGGQYLTPNIQISGPIWPIVIGALGTQHAVPKAEHAKRGRRVWVDQAPRVAQLTEVGWKCSGGQGGRFTPADTPKNSLALSFAKPGDVLHTSVVRWRDVSTWMRTIAIAIFCLCMHVHLHRGIHRHSRFQRCMPADEGFVESHPCHMPCGRGVLHDDWVGYNTSEHFDNCRCSFPVIQDGCICFHDMKCLLHICVMHIHFFSPFSQGT